MKTRYLLGIISLIAMLFVGCGNRQLVENNKGFNNKIKEATSGRVELKELTNFEWDKAYTFRPYLSKEEISKIIGINSENLFDTMVDESLINILFVKDGIIKCSIIGRPENLGYSFDFGQYKEDYICFSSKEDYIFEVKKEDGINMFEYKK